MKVISLVPSWTETLIESGTEVVGRTRYCLHPEEKTNSIPVVGGTKTPDIAKIKELAPDVVILDKEENTRETAQALAEFNLCVTHVTSMKDLPDQLAEIAANFEPHSEPYENLKSYSKRWQSLLSMDVPQTDIDEIPGVIQWYKKPEETPAKLVYLIWHNPWMSVSQNTFIGSVLSWLNLKQELFDHEMCYPEIGDDVLDDQDTLLLASSEPFPFEKKGQVFSNLRSSVAIVDGEVFSWFGYRSLVALEDWLQDRS